MVVDSTATIQTNLGCNVRLEERTLRSFKAFLDKTDSCAINHVYKMNDCNKGEICGPRPQRRQFLYV